MSRHPAPIAVLCPTPNEMAPILRHLTDLQSERVGGIDVYRAWLDERPILLVRTGIGRLYAAMAATAVIERHAPDALLLSGVAASLGSGLAVGDLLVPECIADADDGYIADGTLQSGGFRLYDPAGGTLRLRRLAADADLRAVACRQMETLALKQIDGSGAKLHGGVLATGAAFLRCSRTKASIAERLGATAYEMEAAAVAQVAAAYNTPFAVIRAISDTGDDALAADPFTPLKVHYFADQADTDGREAPPNPSNPGARRSAEFNLAFANAAALTLATVRSLLGNTR